MAYGISLTKRTNGGFTIVTENGTYYPSTVIYHGTTVGVALYSRGVTTNLYKPTEWTINGVSGFTTVVQVCDAIDALGMLPSDTFEDMEALLTTIDADTSAIVTAVQLMDDDLDDARIALQVIDDWDESDRAKVNIIAGQAGIAAGAGAVGVTVPRVTLASDDPAVTALQSLDNSVDGNYLNVNLNVAGTDVSANSGDLTAQTLRVAIATNDVNVAKMVTALEIMDDWDDSNYCNVNLNVAGTDVAGGTGDSTAQTLRVVLATNQPQLTNKLLVTEDSASSIKTAVELIDDTVKTLGTDTYAEATTKGLVIGAVRTDAEAALANTTNEISPLSLSSVGRLKVESQGRTTAPAVLVAVGSPQNVTTGWVDFGTEITTNGAHTLVLWAVVTHTNSVNDRVRILGKHTATTGAEFLIPIKTISSTDVKVNGHYYELDSDATQNVVLDWDVSAVPIVQVQIQCETVGATADTVSGDYTLMY